MTSFADLVDARWRLLAAPDDRAGRLRYDATRERFDDLFTRSRHVMAALEAS